ncbi:MAG: sel1 repeat family protein [Magnetococcales bacterium]|nr:sel1 repeat family protein [Magnetococcales bacterium]
MGVKKSAQIAPPEGSGGRVGVGKLALAGWAVFLVLALWSGTGWSASPSPKEANPAREFQEAVLALKNGFPSMAYNLFRRLAEKGDPRSQYLVGRMLEDGLGVARDPMQAAPWYRKAAQQDHVEAQARLGFLYLGGTTVPQDDAESLKWFQTAAEKGGHPVAQAYLCSLYAEGKSVQANQKLSMDWCRKAAEQGVAAAQTMLGFHYALGRGSPPDPVAARKWFELAARQGHAQASKALAEMDRGESHNPGNTMPESVTQPVEKTESVTAPMPRMWE